MEPVSRVEHRLVGNSWSIDTAVDDKRANQALRILASDDPRLFFGCDWGFGDSCLSIPDGVGADRRDDNRFGPCRAIVLAAKNRQRVTK